MGRPKKQISEKGRNPVEREKIKQAVIALIDKPVVTQNDIARLAGVGIGRVSVCKRADAELNDLINRAVKTPEQRIRSAIKYFKDRGEKAGSIAIMERAMVGVTGFYNWCKWSEDIKKDVDDLAPKCSVKDQIITAIRQMIKNGEVLTDKNIIEKSGVGERTFYRDKNDLDIVNEMEKGKKPPTPAEETLSLVNDFIRARVKFATKKGIFIALNISNHTLWRHEKKEPKLRKAIKKLLSQSQKQMQVEKFSLENMLSPLVKKRIYSVLRSLKRQLELGMEVSREMICELAKIDMDLLVAYERDDPVLKEDVQAVLPLPPARKIELAILRMHRINQPPTNEAFAVFTKLPIGIIVGTIKNNKILRDKIEALRIFLESQRNSITSRML